MIELLLGLGEYRVELHLLINASEKFTYQQLLKSSQAVSPYIRATTAAHAPHLDILESFKDDLSMVHLALLENTHLSDELKAHLSFSDYGAVRTGLSTKIHRQSLPLNMMDFQPLWLSENFAIYYHSKISEAQLDPETTNSLLKSWNGSFTDFLKAAQYFGPA